MSQKRSYLESLNAGRQRRHSTSIERLNRTLEDLEGRIERHDAGPAYRDLASDMQKVRAREEELASISQILGDLQKLREDLGHGTDAGIAREAPPRRGIEHGSLSSRHQDQTATLRAELERLSSMIEEMARRGDDRTVHMLRLEIEEIKAALGELAREDTVRSVGQRWEELDRRWDSLASDLRAAGANGAPREMLEDRLDKIEKAVRALPEALSMRTLEDKLRRLAAVIDEIGAQQERFAPEAIESIERRLDELSRAIVASTSARHERQFDPEPLERIEARLGALARQIEDLAAGQGFDISNQIETINNRVDELTHRVELPENVVEKLAAQIASISAKLDNVPEPPEMDHLLREMDHRFAAIVSKLDERQDSATVQEQTLLRELEQRIEQIAGSVERRLDASTGQDLFAALDQRLSDIRERLDRQVETANVPAIGHIEERLDELARRLEAASATSGIDPALISSLHDQMAGLAEHVMRPDRFPPEFEELGPRLDYIERSITETRDKLVEAARQAAEDAVRTLGESHDAAFASEIGQELRNLEKLTRTSDERNARTFEAIHDTLIKIVDRLGSVEKRQLLAQTTADEQREIIDTPSIAPEIDTPDHGNHDQQKPPAPHRSAVEAASLAARAAVETDAHGKEATERQSSRSLLGGITRALKGNKDRRSEDETERKEPSTAIEFDQPLDPKLANQPLEPGSGVPDLNAIMRRVRDQHDGPDPQSSNAAKSDFITAARRAAQAAAAEAQATKGRPAEKEASRGGLSRFLPGRKSAVIGLAALVVFIGALQLGRTLLSTAPDTASTEPPALSQEIASETSEDVATTNGGTASDYASMAQDGEERAMASPLVAEAEPTPRVVDAEPAETSVVTDDRPVDLAGNADEMETAALTNVGHPVGEPEISVPTEAGPAALREAAEQGNALALFEIGNRYADGRGVEANMEEAARWYEMAAEKDLAVAQYKIGSFYEKGNGVQRNVAQAESWYDRAAEQCNAAAMHNLGVLLAMGASGATDNETAAHWFLKAAEFGVTDSQFNMGILAAKGIGMEQDLKEGYKWFALVADAGDEDAAAKRDEIAELLSPDQLEKAQAAATLWRARTPDAESNSIDIPEAWTESSETTSSIDMRQAVAEMQRVLNARGYDAGPADGIIGRQTRSAITAFQRDNGLEADGEITQEVVRALLERR
jgi:localization factor PodJL